MAGASSPFRNFSCRCSVAMAYFLMSVRLTSIRTGSALRPIQDLASALINSLNVISSLSADDIIVVKFRDLGVA
jgi:hypothetical protein